MSLLSFKMQSLAINIGLFCWPKKMLSSFLTLFFTVLIKLLLEAILTNLINPSPPASLHFHFNITLPSMTRFAIAKHFLAKIV